MDKVYIQIYSVRDPLLKDYVGTIKKLSEIGHEISLSRYLPVERVGYRCCSEEGRADQETKRDRRNKYHGYKQRYHRYSQYRQFVREVHNSLL